MKNVKVLLYYFYFYYFYYLFCFVLKIWLSGFNIFTCAYKEEMGNIHSEDVCNHKKYSLTWNLFSSSSRSPLGSLIESDTVSCTHMAFILSARQQ